MKLSFFRFYGRLPPVFRRLTASAAAVVSGFLLASVCSLLFLSPRGFSAPCDEWRQNVTSPFGARRSSAGESPELHRGVDIARPAGSEIRAVQSGVVSDAVYAETGYGVHLVISHPNGWESLYAHCSALLVGEGDIVRRGQPIALSGSTGDSTGPHLHLELRKSGTCADPEQLLPK